MLPARHTPAETGFLLEWRPEVSAMQIAQQATELAIADLVTTHEQRLEQLGEEPGPLRRCERPGEIGDGVCLGVGERD
jgi:hypothetical protein